MSLPGSNWVLDLPDHFKIEEKIVPAFVGSAGETLVVFDAPPQKLTGLPVPKKGDMSDIGTDNEARVEAVEMLTIDGHTAFLLQQRFEAQKSTGLTLLVEGKGSNANVVTRLTDELQKKVSIADVRKLMMSLKEKILSDAERLDALPFEIKDAKGFTLVGVVGNSIAVFTDGPDKNVAGALDQASVTVMLSPPGPQDISPEMLAIFDQQKMLDNLLLHQLQGAVIAEKKGIMANDMPGIEMNYRRASADGKVKLKGSARFIATGKRLLMIYTSYPESDAAKAAATVKLADSVAMKKKTP